VSAQVDLRAIADLSVGHLAADFGQGALPAVLVFLKPVLHLSYAQTAVIVLVATVASSVAQPFFGHWSDRHRTPWLMPASVCLSGVGIACAAAVDSYWATLGFVAVSGFGTGAFHPEALKIAGHASGSRRASAMSLFQTGGNLGFGLGPILAGLLIGTLGRQGGLLLVLPGLLVALALVHERAHLTYVRSERSGHGVGPPGADRHGAFRCLLFVIGLRSVAYYGLFTFVPLWEVSQGHSRSYANTLLSLVLLAGAIGTLSAGPLADRFGRRSVLLGSFVLVPGLIVLYVTLGGALGAVAVCLAGAAVVSTFSVTNVLAQEYLPSRVAFASGVSVGLATGLGGVAAVALGAIADAVDLRTALLLTAAGPALGTVVALWLPRETPGGSASAIVATE
jgi:FSR family fosmidomycin resistance protein-like MFS transporter